MDDITKSLNRIEGQIRGINRMRQEERDCIEVIQQIAAARSALKRVAEKILTHQAINCSKDAQAKEELERLIVSLTKV